MKDIILEFEFMKNCALKYYVIIFVAAGKRHEKSLNSTRLSSTGISTLRK